MLGNEPGPVCHFLLLTSVLRWLSGPLCDALTGDANGHEMLSLLERKSMFLSREGGTRDWFRYHRLFRDLIRHELQSEMPEKEGRFSAQPPSGISPAGTWTAPRPTSSRPRNGNRSSIWCPPTEENLFESSEPATALAWLTKVPVHVRAERKLVLLQEAILNTMVGKTHVAAE